MRIGNWCKKLSATLVAAGIFVPGVAEAVNIPLADPSFEDYTVPAPPGYAYAADPLGTYRPTSASGLTSANRLTRRSSGRAPPAAERQR